MKLSRDRLRQIINEEVAMAKEFPPISEDATTDGEMDPEQLLQTVDDLDSLVTDVLNLSDDPEVVERMERAARMVDQLYNSLSRKVSVQSGFDDGGYSKMAGTRPMEEVKGEVSYEGDDPMGMGAAYAAEYERKSSAKAEIADQIKKLSLALQDIPEEDRETLRKIETKIQDLQAAMIDAGDRGGFN